MKIAISYRHVEFPQLVEAAVNRHLQKIGTLFKRYAPDLVQVHGAFDKNPHNDDSPSPSISRFPREPCTLPVRRLTHARALAKALLRWKRR